jgi:LDH2 family malate/lactate/ureidoglycolate dehydrogenase
MIQALSGPLCGAASIPAPGTDYGFFLLAMRADVFADSRTVGERMAELAAGVRAADGMCPGERSEAARRQCREQGFEVDDRLWGTICSLSGDR